MQALLTHVPVVLLNAGLVGWLVGILVSQADFSAAFFWYMLVTILVNLGYITWSIVALVQAHKGRFFYMPLAGRFCFNLYYGPRADAHRSMRRWENKPPERS